MRAITYGDNKYVAVGSNGYSGSNGYFTTSADGTSFSTPARFNDSSVSFSVYGLAFGNNTFVASGWGGPSAYGFYSTSTNGTTWSTPSTSSNVLSYNYGLGFGGGRFVSVGANGSGIPTYSTSTNGYSWSTATTMPSPVSNGQMNAVTYTGANWVAVGHTFGGFGFYSTSTNGTTWSAPAYFNGSEDSGAALSVASNGLGTVVAVGGIGASPGIAGTATTYTYSTNNGASWSSLATFPDTSSTNAVVMTSIVYNTAKSQFYAVGATSTGTAVYATSTNGISWNGLYAISGEVVGNPQAVAVNSTGTRQVMVGYDLNNNYPTFIYN
jgi:hypothetical protein